MSDVTAQTPESPKKQRRPLAAAGRWIMGLLFLMAGLNGFLHFIPEPAGTMPEDAGAFVNGLKQAHYMLPLISGTQVFVGVLLVLNRFVPLALILIAPVVVNIVAIHVFLLPAGLPIALVVLVIELYLIWAYRDAYRSVFCARVIPRALCERNGGAGGCCATSNPT